jgi:hypothetical protein
MSAQKQPIKAIVVGGLREIHALFAVTLYINPLIDLDFTVGKPRKSRSKSLKVVASGENWRFLRIPQWRRSMTAFSTLTNMSNSNFPHN